MHLISRIFPLTLPQKIMVHRVLLVLQLSFLVHAVAIAQDCSAFFPFEKGTSWEFTSYNKKGNMTSVAKQQITMLDEEDGVITAKINSTITDAKGNDPLESFFNMKCVDGVVSFDLMEMLNPSMKEGLSGLEMSFNSEDLAVPSNLQVGASLPDANTEIKAGTNGVTIMTIRFEMTNRKVESREKVTVGAGTFDCYKISYSLVSKTIFTKTFDAAVWYSEKVGTVKTETYDKKGNLEERSELTKFKRG
jgi:hypothetical protein